MAKKVTAKEFKNEKLSLFIKICDILSKYSIYIAVFLVPIFFLPWTSEVLDFNKQILIILLVFTSLFAFISKVIISGKFEFKKSILHIFAGILLLAYFFSTIFSYYRHGSFWGQFQQSSESMLTLIGFLILYFLVSNIFSKKDILTSAIILYFSAIIVELFGILQILGLYIIPLDFARSPVFNTLGSVGSLGVFTAVLFPLAIMLLIIVKKWWKFLFVLQILLSILVFVLINYFIIWCLVIIVSALTLILGTIKSDLFDGKWMALPMFFLTIALFFIILNLQINWLPQKPNEIFLSQKAGFNIAMQSLKENPVLGSGPGTFSSNFSKFKNPEFSKSSLWSVTFNKSSSKILNNLATTGLFGFLALFSFIAFSIFWSIKFLIGKNKINNNSENESYNKKYSILFLGLTIALIGQSVSYFLYNSNISLDFIYFLIIAWIIIIIPSEKKEYFLKKSPLINLLVIFIFTIVFIFGLGVLIMGGQRYIAEVNYYQGLIAYQNNQKTEGFKKIETAVNLNPKSDLYLRQLSQVYLLKLQDELQILENNPNEEQKNKIQNLISNSINAGKMSTDINSYDANNWAFRGYVYQSLLGILPDASQWAITSYDSAIKLDPYNPYLFTQEGNIYLAQALNSSTENNQLLEKAKDKLEKAIDLNPNYSNALYSLGLVYDNLGQKDKAKASFEKIKQLNPEDKNIQQILDNLNAGQSALQAPIVSAETPPGETKNITEK